MHQRLRIRLDLLTDDDGVRGALYVRRGECYGAIAGATILATGGCGRVFRETTGDAAVRDQLARLAAVLDNWQGLANVYQAYLDDEPGDTPETAIV